MMSLSGGKWQNLTASEDYFSNYIYILKKFAFSHSKIEET